MDLAKLPIGFSMELAQNTPALEKFGQMPQQQRHRVIERARGAHSEQEMQRIVSGLMKE